MRKRFTEKVTLFLLVLLGLCLGFASGEGLVRFTGAAPAVALIAKGRFQLSANPLIGYEPIPNLSYEGEALEWYDYRGKSNSLGFRDREHAIDPTPDKKRVIVIGDSITYGLWINEPAKIFTAVLESSSQQSTQKFEVLNFGVPGYNTQQEVEMLKDRGLRFKPDIVILAYCLNDRWRDDGNLFRLLLETEQNTSAINISVAEPLLVHSAAYRFFRYRLFANRSTESKAKEVESRFQVASADTVERYIAKLGSLSKQYNFQPVVAIFPNFDELEQYQYYSEHRAVQSVAAQNGIATIDLTNHFRECKNLSGQSMSFDRFHPNELGHACAGKALNDYLQSLK